MMTLKQLLTEAYPELPVARSVPDLLVRGLECDSRKVGKDFVFVAIPGVKADGNAFIREALTRGAVAVVGERAFPDEGGSAHFLAVPEARVAMARMAAAFYGHPARRLKAVGITGTNGKTTSSYLIEHLLEREKRRVGVLGTVNYRFAGREIPAVETTPGPLKTQEILADMVAGGCDFAVMEVSSHALHQKRVAGIDFAVALFTNLTQDHLDYHGSLEAYFECKATLFSGLSANGRAVLNADDDWGRRLGRLSRCENALTYAVDREADFRASDLRPEAAGTAFVLEFMGEKIPVRLPLAGRHNVYNALGAVAVAHALGLDVRRAAASLESFAGVPGRLESVDRGQDFSVFVDFAHTPDGLDNVLRSLLPYKKGKLLLVFGCGGDRDRGKRPEMARIAARHCDTVIVTSDNPRGEDPRAIVEEVRAGFPAEFTAHTAVVDRRKAIRLALLSARAGDIVLLAGKGHERTQIIGGESFPFSDREEAERVLDGR
ncbi:MAG TPA: UDP-N-acetylmuramoyl-L-alanyl-D-glutamate--2,6-diaminopimelate ligase [Candidatus Eisenbacteria bacterium]|jgi:UDP-N-acetylmuramoyl-L-alanyl-D-glutamate--2,6-diaminopimelate ligase|nr:UDP-N-acetylmuramoyl-L-alanyl-D-glutamate--2,6-diaminopimelate ligase [Candidatus Eisenbacteria bacterium]